MSRSFIHATRNRAFTLVETIMAMASVGVVGLSVFYTLYYGLLLYTKNTAMNVSHQEARLALLQLNTDIHAAVSPLCLTDSNGVMLSSTTTGASAGVEFQVMLSSTNYCQLATNVAAGSSSVSVGLSPGYPTPYPGSRLIIPDFEVESDISAVSVTGTTAQCTLAQPVTSAMNGTANNIPCFFTQRVYYYVSGPPSYVANGQTITPPLTLYYIGVGRNSTFSIGSEDLSCRTPFSIPSVNSAPNFKAVSITGLSAQDPQTTFLNSVFKFTTSSIMLSGTVPVYSILTTAQ